MSDDNETLGLPFVPASPESKAAAEAVKPYANTARYRVWMFIRDNPRSTDQAIGRGLDMNPNTVRPRRVELESAGLIRPEGEIRLESGLAAVAYVVTGVDYPEDWSTVEKRSGMHRRRAERPTAEEIDVAVKLMREVWAERDAAGRPFPAEAVKVMQWLAKHLN